MGLARMWSRQLFGVSGVALAVPGALAVTLAILALGGSFGHLASIGQLIGGPSLARDTGAAPGIAGGTPQLAAAIRSAPHLSSALRGGSVGQGTPTAGTTGGSPGNGSQGTGTSHHHGGATTTGPSSVSTATNPTAGRPQNPVGALLGKVVGLVSGTVGNVTGALAKVLTKVKLPPVGTPSVSTTKSLTGL